MVNVSGRSKGCYECRQRKVKCDEAFPRCISCAKKGLRCSGARRGAFFVHSAPTEPRTSSIAMPTSLDQMFQHVSQQVSRNNLLEFNKLWRSSPLTGYQPSRANIFDRLFVSHFIESFGFKAPVSTRQPPTWLDELVVFTVAPKMSLVQDSIRASSMFFYGTLSQDPSIQAEACKWYSRALRGLHGLLSQASSHFTGDVICAAVMLIHFEHLAGTSEDAWVQHVKGASKMLEAGGPESCRDGFLHQLFRHLRLLTFVASIYRNEQHAFALPEWTNIPFQIHPKTAFDELIDILFRLLPCLSVADKIITATTDTDDWLQERLNTMVLDMIFQLYKWWSQCISMPSPVEAPANEWMNANKKHTNEDPYNPSHFPLLIHTDMPTAALGSVYDSANLIALRLLFLSSTSAYLYEERIQRHAQSILSAKEFIAAVPGPSSGRGSLMLGFPLRIMRIWNPPIPENAYEKSDDNEPMGSSARSKELFAHVASYIFDHYVATSKKMRDPSN
ncbi:hypothetical protein N7499_008104 [Penicillium canescens]|uniref:Zn(2)-C6 fungal-type domain-containing protein n=1 Tax=Penicillium canescens TaxID=5083 RepID=A0AAD6HZH4_PENCN|nr:uncharacterized protein N7446_013139 [Penicillium canescens]KAJ6022787.1 hypothetical protein N7460_013182 [Penicillium canescens]KAJ6042073.1 hypothetical protein N7446_013139 [Penicillium canescens]KAJ6076123.1 hypothetical protein N7499_008104 [Penicillium canescens]KAJ6158435.1 hypothetical protein N7485_011261 [Penicillium canescens]